MSSASQLLGEGERREIWGKTRGKVERKREHARKARGQVNGEMPG